MLRECFEQLQIGVADFDSILGVPLHSQDKALTRVFDSFNDSIAAKRAGDHAGSEAVNPLMMARIDGDLFPSYDAAQQGASGN